MANIAVTPKSVRIHQQTKSIDKNAGGAGNVGDEVYIAADGDVEVTDASSAGTTYGFGVVVAVVGGSLTFVAGDRVNVAYDGIVYGFSGMTPNDVIYVSDDAGKLEDAPGTTTHKVGRALSATELLLIPAVTEA